MVIIIVNIPARTAALPHSPPVGERRTMTCICGTVRRRDRRDRFRVRVSDRFRVIVSDRRCMLVCMHFKHYIIMQVIGR